MNPVHEFLDGHEKQMGVFYPSHHLLAVFRTEDGARKAAQEIRRHGFAEQDVLMATGDDMVTFAANEIEHEGIWGKLMRGVSRALATGEVYAEHDWLRAESGAGFLFVHCASEADKDEAWKTIEPLDPVVARYYHPIAGIEHFVGETEHAP